MTVEVPDIAAWPSAPIRAGKNKVTWLAEMQAWLARQESSPDELNNWRDALNAWKAELLAHTSGVDFIASSASSVAIGTGVKTFVVDQDKLYTIGQYISVASTASPANAMYGRIDSYDPVDGDLAVNVISVTGAGTFASWSIGLAPFNGAYAALASPAFTGTPTAPTAAPGTSTTQLATTAFAQGAANDAGTAAVATVRGGAPGTLDTLDKIAQSIGDNTDLMGVITAALALKANVANPVFTGGITGVGYPIVDGAGFAINPRNGNSQIVTLAANRTPVASGWVDGDWVELIVNGAGFAITWSTFGVTWIGTQPSLSPLAGVAIHIVQIGGVRYGWQSSRPLSTDIQYVGAPAAASGSTPFPSSGTASLSLTALTGGVDTQARVGDFVLVFLAVSATSDENLQMSSAGYTEITDLAANDTTDTNFAVYWKIMSSSPDATAVAVVPALSGDTYAMAVQVWRNVDQTNPLDVAIQTATGIDSVLANPPAASAATAGNVAIACGAGAHTGGAQTFTASGLSAFQTIGANGSRDITLGVGYVANTIGTFDQAAFGFSTSDNVAYSWAAATIILRKAS